MRLCATFMALAVATALWTNFPATAQAEHVVGSGIGTTQAAAEMAAEQEAWSIYNTIREDCAFLGCQVNYLSDMNLLSYYDGTLWSATHIIYFEIVGGPPPPPPPADDDPPGDDDPPTMP